MYSFCVRGSPVSLIMSGKKRTTNGFDRLQCCESDDNDDEAVDDPDASDVLFPISIALSLSRSFPPGYWSFASLLQ